MKTEKFFEIFTELDDELIENALPKENAGKRPAARPVLFRALAVSAAAAAACGAVVIGTNAYRGKINTRDDDSMIGIASAHSELPTNGAGTIMPGGATVGENSDSTLTHPVESFQPSLDPTSNNAAVAPVGDGVKYSVTLGDWQVYNSVEDLVENGDIIVSGKVTGISFALIDSAGNLADKGSLCTIYDVSVINSYKGFSEKALKIRMSGGLRDYRTDEQLALMPKDAQYIPIMAESPDIKTDGEYLFILKKYGSSMPTIINPEQTAFPLNDNSYKDAFANASANDIIAYLNG